MLRSLVCVLAIGASLSASAGVLRYCDPQGQLSVGQQNRLLQFSEIAKAELEKTGANVALVSSSGLDLKILGVRYSHTGVSLKKNGANPWAVRQLYYDCAEKKPRIFDQGMAGFVMGVSDADVSYLSIVFVSPGEDAGAALERTALDNQQAVALLGPNYSANAYPFSTQFQNCNQWVMELLATAWGGLTASDSSRAQAQAWLKQAGYAPKTFSVGFRPLLWISGMFPWLHSEDHPEDNLSNGVYQTSMPSSVEAFVHSQVPGAQRIELCKTQKYVVIRRGWDNIPEGCKPEPQDQVVALEQ